MTEPAPPVPTTSPAAVAAPIELPPYTEAFRQRGRLVLMILVGIIGVLGVAGGLFFATQSGDANGTGLSILFALVPLPLLWLSYWWLDRYEPEPRRYLVAAFVWGGVVSVALAIVAQILVERWLDLDSSEMASFVAPLTEEPAKGLFLLVVLLRARRVIDGMLDGLILSGVVGIGFAFVENIGYYASSYLGSPDIELAGAEGVTTTFVVRGVVSPLAHPLFTSAFGIAIGLAVTRRSWLAKISLGVGGMAISILLHGLWNGSLSYGGGVGFVLVYLALAVILAGVITVAIVVRMRQVRTLERSLSYVAERGWIHPAEIPYLSRFSYRRTARRFAVEHHGKTAGKVVTRYQRLATEMAFLHDRVMQGQRVPHGVERTYALLDAMHDLRPHLRLPPALMPFPRR